MHFDPTTPEFRKDPYPLLARLRDEAPVGEIANFGMDYLSRHADVASAFKQPLLMSSSGLQEMVTEQSDMMGTGMRDDPAQRPPPSLIFSDPPVHDHLRNIVNRGFTPRQIAGLEPRVREIAEELVGAAVERGATLDLVHDLAIPLPVRVIAELLGVEPSRYQDFKRWSDATVTSSTGIDESNDPERLAADREELRQFLADVVAERRKAPRDDLISTVISGGPTDRVLTDLEAQGFASLLLIAGNETTTNLLGNAMRALLAHPDQLRKVIENPDLIPGVIEETLRWDSPVQSLFRKTTAEVEFSGTKIPEGRMVMLLLNSANRDERHFDDGERFDITRRTSGHLGFGLGVHFCLGASLARLEARVTLEALFARCTDFALETDEVEFLDSLLIRGPRALPLSFRANDGG